MTPDILLVFGILVVVIGVLITEVMPLEVLALLVLGVLAITGLVSPTEALAGFSNPAVVTIWAVFILSGGLTRTGIANILGRYMLKIVGNGEARLVLIIMLIAGGLSAFMNNVAVAALMLPVVMDITRKTGRSPSRILMPLAYGSLLGGLTTMIGTPPNILVSEALRANGLTPFGLFDFTPVGLIVMFAGMLFVTFVCIRLLPDSSQLSPEQRSEKHVLNQYRIQERLFRIQIPKKSSLAGQTLASSNLGSRLGLNVVAIMRGGQTSLAPDIYEKILAGDELIVEGRLDQIQEMNKWGQLLTENLHSSEQGLQIFGMEVAKIQLTPDSSWINKTLSDLSFRNSYGLNVLAVVRSDKQIDHNVKSMQLRSNDVLVIHGPKESIDQLSTEKGILPPQVLDQEEIKSSYELGRKVRLLTVPENSHLIGLTVTESHLGGALDVQILAIIREDDTALVPTTDVHFEPGDRLVVSGMSDLAAVLLMQGVKGVFENNHESPVDLSIL
ncbi:MAG: SLC13 family permease, partial [Desulforhopalus sp.]